MERVTPNTAEAVAALEPYLPRGVALLPILWWSLLPAPATCLGCTAGCCVAGIPLRRLSRSSAVHWTQRARAGFPLAYVSAISMLGLPPVFGIIATGTASPIGLVPAWLMGVGA